MKVYPIFEKKDRQKFELFFKTTNTRNYVLFIAGANTGFRIGDLLRLKKEDVKGNFIEMTEQKTGKKRTIKINKKLKAVLKDYLKTIKDNGYLFPSRVGGGNKPISVRRAQQIIKAAAEKIGISDNINTHSLRKTFAYQIYEVTKSLSLVQEILNHSKETITMRYLCLSHLMLNDATEAIADL